MGGGSLRELFESFLCMPNEQLRGGMEGLQLALDQGILIAQLHGEAAAAAVRFVVKFVQDLLEERRRAGITA